MQNDAIKNFAKLTGQTEADVAGFAAGIAVWLRKGFSLEQAIAKHMEQMTRLVNNTVKVASVLSKSPEFVSELHSDFRA